MKIEHLSDNIVIVMQEMIKNERLIKYLVHNNINPQSRNGITNADSLIMTKIFPTPFYEEVITEEQTQIRVFSPSGELENKKISQHIIVFEIVIHNSLWLIRESKNISELVSKIRPYEIMYEIIRTFENKSIGTLGILIFDAYKMRYVTKDFTTFHLTAEIMGIG